jgi:hypothetical protein
MQSARRFIKKLKSESDNTLTHTWVNPANADTETRYRWVTRTPDQHDPDTRLYKDGMTPKILALTRQGCF